MNNDILYEIISKMKYLEADVNKIKYLESDVNKLKVTNIKIITSINNIKSDISQNKSTLEQYQSNINNSINKIINNNKQIEKQYIDDIEGLYKHINSINDELSEIVCHTNKIKNEYCGYRELEAKIEELESQLLESNNEFFDTIDSLETEFDDFKDELEIKLEITDNKLEDIEMTINTNLNNLYDEMLDNFTSNEDLALDYEEFDKSDIDHNDINLDIDIQENNDVFNTSNFENDNIFIPEPKKYISICNLETFLKYKNILEFYNVEKEYTFLDTANIFDSFEVLFFNIIKILNNKYRHELSEFIKKDYNSILFEELPSNELNSSNFISLNEYYYEQLGYDFVGEIDLYVNIPDNNIDILHSIFMIISEIDDFNCTLSLDFVFNDECIESYKNKLLLEAHNLNILEEVCFNNIDKEVNNIDSFEEDIFFNKSTYYPSKKQKRRLKKLLKLHGYEFKIELNSLTKKEVESLINILGDKKTKTIKEDEILNKFLKKTNSIKTFNIDYFIKCVEEGYSVEDLSNEFEMPISTIYKKKRELGLSKVQKSAKDMIDNEYFIELYNNNYTIKMLAKEFNVPESIINAKKKELGLIKNLKNLINTREEELENISYDGFTNTIPITLYINDNEVKIENNTWRETYSRMCDYLISINEDSFKEYSSLLHSNSNNYSYYFSTDPSVLRKPHKLQNGNYYIELHCNVYTFVTNIQTILKNMNLSEDIFHIQFIRK